MMQLYLRKKFFRSSLFFLTPLFLPQWGKLNTTRSNTRPWREAHSPSFLQSTPNSTAPPEQTSGKKSVPQQNTSQHKSESINKLVPEFSMTWMLSAAPSCRSASSWLCRQVAVMLVAVSECDWLREAEYEKFPSPTSNMDRERDMCSPNGNDGDPKTQFSERLPRNLLPLLLLWVPKEETRVGATLATFSLLHGLIWL